MQRIEAAPSEATWADPLHAAKWESLVFRWGAEDSRKRPRPVFDRVVGIEIGQNQLQDAVELEHLRVVQMCYSSLSTPEELLILERLQRLEALILFGTVLRYQPHAAFRLPPLPRLRGLNCGQCQFRGAGLEGMPFLEVLDLSKTDITDADLHHLARLAKLRVLRLDGNPITDAAVPALQRHAILEYLDVRQTQITPASKNELRRALPACDIP